MAQAASSGPCFSSGSSPGSDAGLRNGRSAPTRAAFRPRPSANSRSTLEPGAAIVAVLLEHSVGRTPSTMRWRGPTGCPLANEFVDATTLGDIAPDLLAAATRSGTST